MWSQAQMANAGLEFPEGFTGAMINGALVPLEVGASFVGSVMQLVADAGMGKFRVFLNGDEIDSEDAPSIVEAEMQLQIVAYDEAGC